MFLICRNMRLSKKFCIFIIYLLLSDVYAKDTTRVPEEDVGNANEYIDEVLQNLRNDPSIVEKLDPLTIPDFKEDKIEGSDGVIRGLSSLYRSGDCSITYDGEVATVVGEIAVRDVNLFLRYRAKALFFWIKGRAEGRVDHLAVRLVLTAKDGKAQLSEFKVTNLGNYKITKITGMSVVLNWLLKLIANSVAKKSRGKIIDALETNAAKAVNDIFKKIEIPLF